MTTCVCGIATSGKHVAYGIIATENEPFSWIASASFRVSTRAPLEEVLATFNGNLIADFYRARPDLVALRVPILGDETARDAFSLGRFHQNACHLAAMVGIDLRRFPAEEIDGIFGNERLRRQTVNRNVSAGRLLTEEESDALGVALHGLRDLTHQNLAR